jgi:hypothetical protein
MLECALCNSRRHSNANAKSPSLARRSAMIRLRMFRVVGSGVMWWVNFRRGSELTGVAIIEAPTLFHARMRPAVHGIGEAKEVDADLAVGRKETGGRLSVSSPIPAGRFLQRRFR